jgi:hypothetical protein
MIGNVFRALTLALPAFLFLSLTSSVFAEDSYSVTSPTESSARFSKIELKYVGRQTDRLVIDNGPPGHSISDTADSYGELLDAKKNIIGRFDVITRATDVWHDGERRMLVVEYSFGEGRDAFLMMGVGHFMANTGRAHEHRKHVFAVTGGKGRFMGAFGECTVARVNAVDTESNCTLYVPRF